jgi:hypothetical protein
MAYFVMINEQGPAWVRSRGMRDQEKWAEHAVFINGQVDAGVIIAAGPLGNGPEHRALLIVHSADEPTVRTAFAQDPWIQARILRIRTIEPWQILASDDRLDRVLAEVTRGDHRD